MIDQETLGNSSVHNHETRDECSVDRFNTVCEPAFEKINNKLDLITNKLFIDNGGESYQSRLNRHDRWIKAVMCVLGVIAVAVVGILTDLIVRAFV